MEEHNKLSDDLQTIAESLSDVMITRNLPTKTMLTGIHAFLMALQAAGRADAGRVAEQLFEMSEYYYSLSGPADVPAPTEQEWKN